MGNNDGFGPIGNTSSNCLCGNIPSIRVNIGKYRNGTLIQNGSQSAHVCNRRSNDFIARFRINSSDRTMHRSRTTRTSIGILDPNHLSKARLKLLHHIALSTGQGSALNNLPQHFQFSLTQSPPRGFLI